MKRLFALLLAVTMITAFTVTPNVGHAQIVKNLSISAADDTLTNADTATVVLSLDGSAKSVEGLVTKVSGTVAGTVTFQGLTPDGGTWVDIDALTLTNTASQYKLFSISTPRIYAGYRLRFITSGTTVVVPKAYLLRYTGG